MTEPFDETVDAEATPSTSDVEQPPAESEVLVEGETTVDAAPEIAEDVEAVDVQAVEPEAADVEAAEVEAAEPEAVDVEAAEVEAAEPGDVEAAQATDEAVEVSDETAEASEDDAEVSDEAPDIDAPAADPLEEFRESLRTRPGDWFVIHTYSGMEKRVKTNLENRITSLNMEDFIYEVHVPQEDVWEVKNGQRRQVSRTVLPGYVLVRMDLTDESWSAVRHTPSVTGFVGHSHQPVPLSLAEVEAMLAPSIIEEAESTPALQKQKKVEFTDFYAGDSVMVVDGPFATLHATITE
ncbi:MAG: transcription termination/antitermination protein NusG, partial [Nocardioidaceae bacterium]